MKLITQPEGSKLCGQCCIAMIAGISIKKAIEIVGKKGGTSTKDLAAALKKLGFSCSGKRQRIKKDWIPPEAGIYIVFFIWDNDKNKGHWAIWNGDKKAWYDPGKGHRLHRDYIWAGIHKTSFMKVERNK